MRRPKYALDPVRANQGAVPAKDDVPPFNSIGLSNKGLTEIWSQPWLGNATSRELLGELKARMDVQGQLDYRTCEPLKNEGIPTIRP